MALKMKKISSGESAIGKCKSEKVCMVGIGNHTLP